MGKFSNLPLEIIQEILTRLPTEAVLECKLVCKPWRDLVSHNPSFSRMHLTHLTHRGPGKPSFLLSTRVIEQGSFGRRGNDLKAYDRATDHQQFHYIEYIENDDKETHRITRVNINPRFEHNHCIITGSCNGLICISAYHGDKLFYYQPACICNPITKEYILLPKVVRLRNPGRYTICSGFCYLPETNEYKVVRIKRFGGGRYFESVEVYTLGSGNGWRDLGDCGLSFSVDCFANIHGVFVNETLYWITVKGTIVAFNLVDEKFCEPPKLPCLSLVDNEGLFCGIRVLGGCLWCSIHNTRTASTNIWLLKINGNENMMEQEKYLSLCWSKVSASMQPLAWMNSNEILYYGFTNLYSYDIKTSSLKTLVSVLHSIYPPIPHMNTLISLKALGELDTKTME